MSRILLPHQQQILDSILASPHNNRWGLFLEMGLGKTLLACAIASALKDKFDHIIIVCPASLQANWRREIELDNLLLESEYTIFPYSRLSRKEGKLLTITNKTLMILDESHYIKTPSSKRSRYFIKLLKEADPFIISMTGTPDPKGILDLWIQCYLLRAWTSGLELNYWQFQNVYVVYKQFTHFKKIVGEQHRDILMKGFVGKAFFLKKKDVLDLPEKFYEIKYYELTPEQKKYIKKFKDDAMAQSELTSDYIMASIHNFLAVCSGFLVAKFDENGAEYPEPKMLLLRSNPKLEILEDLLLSLENKQVIIFCSRRGEILIVEQLLNKLKLSYCIRIGGSRDNEQSLSRFKNRESQILLATVQSSSTGLTMTNCDTIIYFSNTYDLLHRVQSEDRIHRIGQTDDCTYIDIASIKGPDAAVLENLKTKKLGMEETFKLFLEKI